MVEMAYCLPDKQWLARQKQEDHKPAIILIDAQLEMIILQATFAKEQDRLEMTRIMHATRVEVGGRKTLDLELLFSQI